MIASTAFVGSVWGLLVTLFLKAPISAWRCGAAREREPFFLLRVADQAGGPRRDFVLALFRVVVLEPIPSRSPQRRTLGHAAEDYFFRTLLLTRFAREVKERTPRNTA